MLMQVVGVLAATSTAYSAWKEREKILPAFRDVTREMRWWMPLEVIPAQVAVISVGMTIAYYVPFTSHGWLYLFAGPDGDANANIVFAQVFPFWLGIPFLLMMMLYMPVITLSEERSFRSGVGKNDVLLAVQAFFFGISHCLVGVPLAYGLALTGAGLFFGWEFRRTYRSQVNITTGIHNGVRWTMLAGDLDAAETQALHVSAAYHAIWNWLILSLFVAALALI